MTNIIPMLDELRPFLDADLSRPVRINIDGDEEEEEEDDDDLDSSTDAKSDSVTEEHVAEDQPHPATQKEKPRESEFIFSWTPDDEKNLMDLGLSEFERNQRLENMIARRRARKGLESSMGLHADAASLNLNRIAPLDVHVPPVSVRRNNPFDYLYDSEEIKGLPPVPGSAPSVFSRRRNPFEFPYWERTDSHHTTGDGLHPLQFVSEKTGSSPENFDGFTFEPSSSGDSREEKPNSNVAPHHPTAKSESATYSKYERQLSRLSDPRLSSISEPESISRVVQGCDEVPIEKELLQETHMIPTSNHNKDVSAVQPEQKERNIDFSSMKESLGNSELTEYEIMNKLEPAISDAPPSIIVEGESDDSDTSTEKVDIIYANSHDVTIDPQSGKPYLSTDPNASLNAASQRSDAQPDEPGLPGQDLNPADGGFTISHQNIERSIPYDIGSLSNDDAAWLREIAEMRKVELSGNPQEAQAQSNMHFSSISSTESESYEQVHVNTIQRLDTPMSYSQELAAADNLTGCSPRHPQMPVDEPVFLPSYSFDSECRIDILPPASEEIAADSNHGELHGIVENAMEKSNKMSSDPTLQEEPLNVLSHHDSSSASPKKETVETVSDGSVSFGIDEFGTSQFLDVQSYDEVTARGNEVKELDEGLLSELDVVGDFSIQNLSSGRTHCANKSISHNRLGDNMPSLIFQETQDFCENEELRTDTSQIESHISSLPESNSSTELHTKEYESNNSSLLNSSWQHQNGVTGSIEDVASVPHESAESSGRNVVLDSTSDYHFVSQTKFNEMGDSAKELDAPQEESYHEKMEPHSDMHEVEAESIDDIHHALKSFVNANQFLTELPTNMQFISNLQEAEARKLECTDLAAEQLSVVNSSLMSIQKTEDIDISLHDEARSFEVVHSAVKHQAVCSSDGVSGKSEASLQETFPLLVSSHTNLNEVEASVEDSFYSTKNILSESVVTDSGGHEVEEKTCKDDVATMGQLQVDSVTVVSVDLDDSELKYLDDGQFTAGQMEVCSESAAICSAPTEVEENPSEHLILKHKNAYSKPMTTDSDLSESEDSSIKAVEFVSSQEEKNMEKVAIHSEMHEVEARSVDDIHALFRQQSIVSAYGIIQSEPHELEDNSAENLQGLNLNFSEGQDDGSPMQSIEHSEMHEIEAQSLEDLHMAFGRKITETESETDLHEIDTRSVEELLGKEVQSLSFAMDRSDMHSEQTGGYSEIQEIAARSLDDLNAVFAKRSDDSLAIETEPRGFEAPSGNIEEKYVTAIDLTPDQQKNAELVARHSEMHEVEARSYDELHIILQQQGLFAETVICSEPLKDEVSTVSEELEKETTVEDSELGQERHLKTMDCLKMHEVEPGSLDGLAIELGHRSGDKICEVQTQSAEDSIRRVIIDSDLSVNKDLLDEETPIYGLYVSDEEQFMQLDVPDEGSSGSFVHPELHEIEAHSLDELHLALTQKTTELETIEKEVNLSESPSSFHEIEARSLDDLHLALGKQVTPLKSSLNQSDQQESETQPLDKGNMDSESFETQGDLHEIEVHSLDDLHLALGRQGMLSALAQMEPKVETQTREKENIHSGSLESCLDLPDIEVCSSDGVTLDPSLVQTDLQEVETQPPDKERKILEYASEHPELHEIEAQSIEDINFALEQLMENASARDEHVEIKKTEYE